MKPLSKQRILITGGSGFLGTEVAIQLAAKSCTASIVDLKEKGWNSPIASVEAIRAINPHLYRWDQALGMDWDSVVHLAASKDIRDTCPTLYGANIKATSTAILCAQYSSAYFLNASSAAVCHKSTRGNPYADSKRAAEKMFLFSGLEGLNLRLFNLSHPTAGGGVEAEMRKAVDYKGKITVHGTGGQTRDFIPVQQVAKFIVKCLEDRPTKEDLEGAWTVDVCTGTQTVIMDLAEKVSKQTGGTSIYCEVGSHPGIDKSLGDPRLMRKILGS